MPAHHPIHPTANVIQLRLDAIHNTYTHAHTHTHTSKIHHPLTAWAILCLQRQSLASGRDNWWQFHLLSQGPRAHLKQRLTGSPYRHSSKIKFLALFFQPQVNHENFQKWKTIEFSSRFLNSVNPSYSAIVLLELLYVILLMMTKYLYYDKATV